MAGYIPTWLGRVEHLTRVGRGVHGKSRRAVTLSSGKMSATMVSVTLGAIPWASGARYVRCTRTDFPPQTRPPFQSSRRCVAGTVKFVKSRNSSGERTRCLESARNWLQISLPGPTRAVALAAGTEDGVWSRWSCVERDYPEESSHSPPPSARLHSYSPPFDLHVGSNCGAAGPGKASPGTSSAPTAAPRHSCITTLPASLAPSNTCKYNTNTNTIARKNKNTDKSTHRDVAC